MTFTSSTARLRETRGARRGKPLRLGDFCARRLARSGVLVRAAAVHGAGGREVGDEDHGHVGGLEDALEHELCAVFVREAEGTDRVMVAT